MKELFNKPKLIGIIADVNSGKSNLLYHIIETLRQDSEFNLVTFGLKSKIPNSTQIFSLEELEVVEDSLIILDEVFSLLDLDNRTKKKQIEQTLRLLHHRNNILILSLLPENSKKFLASKFDMCIFKKCTIADCINGSTVKRNITQYCGHEKGTTTLAMPIDKALIYDGTNYSTMNVPYYPKFDSKAGNNPLFKEKKKSIFKKTG
jgi:hypothetical protein